MAPISDFSVILVNGGFEFTTTDTNFHGSDHRVLLWIRNVSDGSAIGTDAGFDESGKGSFLWSNFGYTEANQPSFPLNLEFIVNDHDGDPELSDWNSANDSVFHYNIDPATDDIFGGGNLLREGKYIDVTATDRAILSFDESTLEIENINGENF